MLTDEQIRALLDKAKNDHNRLWLVSRETTAELCTRVLAAEARVKALETEGAQLAANQCHDGYGDEWGNHRCRAQDTLRARARVLEDALRPLIRARWGHDEDGWLLVKGVSHDELDRARKALEEAPKALL